jgi:hypothetical protein
MSNRPTPPDPFARKIAPTEQNEPASLAETLSTFTPKPVDDVIAHVRPVSTSAPDTGRAGRSRRRGDPETRTKSINFRMRPREQDELNALCDRLNKSIPDTIMVLLDNYQRTNGAG